MAGVTSCSSSSLTLISLSSSLHSSTIIIRRRNKPIHVSYLTPFPRLSLALTFARRKNQSPSITSNNIKKKKKKKVPEKESIEEGDFDEDAIEALFNLLEEDLKNDLSLEDGDEELTEEDLAKLEKELEEALGSDEETSGMLDEDDDDEDDAEGEEDDEEEAPVVLKKWQLRRLASALKTGRRKTSIKSLAAELCLDRAVVLELLREPPPDLLLLSAALPDRIVPKTSVPETKVTVEHTEELLEDVREPEKEGKVPVHVMQSRWSMQKRLKKVQIETLERVYNRTKRPTNTMISSVVHVTNLPRKRVIKWFEDKRTEDGVPNDRLPFQRSTSETVLSN
ncbi:hypothetical protein ACHQM5_002469 [Ranunculus cassubicifolius]